MASFQPQANESSAKNIVPLILERTTEVLDSELTVSRSGRSQKLEKDTARRTVAPVQYEVVKNHTNYAV